MTLSPKDAEVELIKRYLKPVKKLTKYVGGFRTAKGRLLAIHRTNLNTYIWFRPPAPPQLDGVTLLADPNNGNSNLKTVELKPLSETDTLRVQIDSLTGLQRFLDWYEGSSDSLEGWAEEGRTDKSEEDFQSDSGVADSDHLDRSITDMVSSVMKTVSNSNGQSVEAKIKEKKLLMEEDELKIHLGQLIKNQDGMCAITGIKFQYRGGDSDDNLLPSADRIDSNGHYERGNIQIVCRFINFWKQASDDSEFRRLLAIVRQSGSYES